jgi:hypothetical protein
MDAMKLLSSLFVCFLLSACASMQLLPLGKEQMTVRLFQRGSSEIQFLLIMDERQGANELQQGESVELLHQGAVLHRFTAASKANGGQYSTILRQLSLQSGDVLAVKLLSASREEILEIEVVQVVPWAVKPDKEIYGEKDRIDLIWTDFRQDQILLNYYADCQVEVGQQSEFVSYYSSKIEHARLGLFRTVRMEDLAFEGAQNSKLGDFEECQVTLKPEIGLQSLANSRGHRLKVVTLLQSYPEKHLTFRR